MSLAFAADDTSGRGKGQAAGLDRALSTDIIGRTPNSWLAGPALISRVSLLGLYRQRRAQTHRPQQVMSDRIP